MVAMIGALVFLGCPWRALLRLAGGDGNAILGILGLVVGVWIGTLFFKSGYNLGRSQSTHSAAGLILPLMALGALVLMLLNPQIPEQDKSGVLFYSLKGPGAMHAPLLISLVVGLAVGFVAQRSRFCTMGALRDLILFRQIHLFSGFMALLAAAFVTNLVLGQFHPGFVNQPVAHTQGLWNFSGMAGGRFGLRPGRRLPGTPVVHGRRR